MKEHSDSDSATPEQFKANHPFMFVILDKDTNVICFMGLVADPKAILEVINEKDLSKEEIQQLLGESDVGASDDSAVGSEKSSTSTG